MEVMCVDYTFRSDIMSQLPFFQSISVTILFPHSFLPFRTSCLRSLWSSPPSACRYQQVLQNIFFLILVLRWIIKLEHSYLSSMISSMSSSATSSTTSSMSSSASACSLAPLPSSDSFSVD